MKELNLPYKSIKIKTQNDIPYVFDHSRKKYLKLTPEEWVRQQFYHYLTDYKSFPPGLLATEYTIKAKKLSRRCDIVAFDRQFMPWLIVECKAPEVKINQQVFDQVAGYNYKLNVDYLVVTNGLDHYACMVDRENRKFAFLSEIPDYKSLNPLD